MVNRDGRVQDSPVLPESPTSRAPLRWATGLCVAALVAAGVVNLAQFASIDAMTADRFVALHRFDTDSMIELSRSDLNWANDRYGLSTALSAIAPGARVLVPTSGPFGAHDDANLDYLVWLRFVPNGPSLEPIAYPDPANLLNRAALDPTRYAIATGTGSARGAPWLLAASGPTDTGDPATFVERVVNGSYRAPAAGSTREFILLRWDVARPGTTYPYQDVLVETSLLPAELRGELRS